MAEELGSATNQNFKKLKGYSSEVVDYQDGIGYQQAIPISGATPIAGEKEVIKIGKTPTQAENHGGGELVGAQAVRGRNPGRNTPPTTQTTRLTECDVQPEETKHGIITTTVLQDDEHDDSERKSKSKRMTFLERPESEDDNLTINKTPQPKYKCNTCTKVVILSSIIIGLLSGITLLVSAAFVCKFTPQHENDWEILDTSEILQSNTILGYQGNSTRVRFKANPEADDSVVDLTLKAVDCQKLVKHFHNRSYTDNYPFTLNQSIFIPARTENDRYELDTTFDYTITPRNGIPKRSSLTIRIFDNIVDALCYESQATDSKAGQKAYLNHSISANTTTNFPFYPTFASYYLVAFESNVTGGTFNLKVSFNIHQIYYDITDYDVPGDCQCQVNSNNDECIFDFSDYETAEMCVLTYNQGPLGKGLNPVMLEVSIPQINMLKRITHRVFFPLSLSLTTIPIYFLLVMLCAVVYSCCTRKKPSGYDRLLENPLADMQQQKQS